jgi:hypothetical protein
MLQAGAYKFVIVQDKGVRLSADMLKAHKYIAQESQQPAIAAGVIFAFDDGTYRVESGFSESLGIYEFTAEHRKALADYMRGAYLMKERG